MLKKRIFFGNPVANLFSVRYKQCFGDEAGMQNGSGSASVFIGSG
jgi:hypothetical protein